MGVADFDLLQPNARQRRHAQKEVTVQVSGDARAHLVVAPLAVGDEDRRQIGRHRRRPKVPARRGIVQAVSTPVESENRMRWRFQRGHYESWYTSLTHLATRTGFWIRYTLESPTEGHGTPYAQLWFARFDPRDPARTFGINRRFPIDELRHEAAPFRLLIGPGELRDGHLRGRLKGEPADLLEAARAGDTSAHEVAWELDFEPSPRTHHHLPGFLYRAPITSTQILSPHLDVRCSGSITVDGEVYRLEREPLNQSHVWGRKHVYSWAWTHCNAFTGADAALEGFTARVRSGALVLPKATLFCLYLDGEALSFTDVASLLVTRSEYATGRYQLVATGPKARIEAEVTCRADDMLLAEYVDPNGDPAYCHYTAIADARVVLSRRSPFVGRFRIDRTLTASGAAHFEWGARAGDPQVRHRHLALR
jgi:hypothetical protein